MTKESRIIIEMGTGNDLYGGDYTKAACRAVSDALRHSSIPLFESLGMDHRDMRVKVTVGVQKPAAVDVDAVAATLPRSRAEVCVTHGGLDVTRPDDDTPHVIATAAVEAFLSIDPSAWKSA